MVPMAIASRGVAGEERTLVAASDLHAGLDAWGIVTENFPSVDDTSRHSKDCRGTGDERAAGGCASGRGPARVESGEGLPTIHTAVTMCRSISPSGGGSFGCLPVRLTDWRNGFP